MLVFILLEYRDVMSSEADIYLRHSIVSSTILNSIT